MELPTMRASEATAIASGLARQLTGEIENINMKYPTAVLDPEFQDIIDQARTGTLPGPTPADAIPTFERLFLAFLASRYVIVPDQP